MHAQNLLSANNIGQINVNLPIKATGAQQGAIEHVRTIRCGDDDDPFLRFETIHLHEQ